MRRIFSPSSADIDVENGPTPTAAVSDHMHEKDFVRQLLEAAACGDAAGIRTILAEVESRMRSRAAMLRVLETPNLMHVTPLMFAARCKGGQDSVRALLRAKATVTTTTRSNCTALTMAAEEGQLASAKLLLEANAVVDIDRRDTRGYTALHLAVENGHADVTKALLDAGASATVPRNNQWTCVLSAAYNGSTDVLLHLASKGVDLNAPFTESQSSEGTFLPLHLAAYNGFDRTLSELARLGAQVDSPMGNGWSPLMVAAAQGHSKAVAALIAIGAAIDYQSPIDRMNALMAAACNEHASACVGLLLQAKASVALRDSRGLDALMFSARLGNARAVQQLVLQRANPRASRNGGATALMDAAAAGSETVVRLLITNGADVNSTNEDGLSALMYASKGGHELAMVPLLQAGANVQKIDRASRTAIAHASTKQVARRLLEAGAISSQLPEALCSQLGLPAPVKQPSAMGTKAKSASFLRHRSPWSASTRGLSSPPDPSASRPILRADAAHTHSLDEALRPLWLEPAIQDSAPLLKIYPENATATQLGAIKRLQNGYRAMRASRVQTAKQSFYMPRGTFPKQKVDHRLRSKQLV